MEGSTSTKKKEVFDGILIRIIERSRAKCMVQVLVCLNTYSDFNPQSDQQFCRFYYKVQEIEWISEVRKNTLERKIYNKAIFWLTTDDSESKSTKYILDWRLF